MKFDQNVCEMIKKRNSLQHLARSRQAQYESFKRHLNEMELETQAILATPAGESKEAKRLREIENQIERAVIQCTEAEYVRKIYEAVVVKLEQVRRHSNNYFLSF